MSKVTKDLPDKILLEKHLLGDAAAFDAIFKRYYDPLFNYAKKVVNETEVAEELTMDVLLRLWQKKEAIAIDSDLRPYLYRAIKNATFNHYRKKVLQTVPIELVPEQTAPVTTAADDQLKYTELEKIYYYNLNQLSPQRQKVFRMSREQNMTYNQIAKDLDLSINTVENYMVASLSFFRKNLKEHADHIAIIIVTSFFY
ncbi:MAG: RNA polymerase sigma-70 factor [Bacteroidota bacterium]